MKISRKFVMAAFFTFVLFLSSGSMEVFTASAATGEDAASGSPLMKVLWASIYLVTVLMLLRRRRDAIELFAANKSFVALTLLAVASVFWSIDPSATLEKGIPLLLSALVGFEFARRYSFDEQLNLIWGVLSLVLVLGITAQIFFPGLVPKEGDDLMAATAWHGIVTSKNTWARLVVLTGVVTLSRASSRRSVLSVGFLMTLIFALLVASRSAGGLIIMAEMTVLFVLFRVLRWRRKKALALLSVFGSCVAAIACDFLLQNFTTVLAMAGKDPTMTGRLPIWQECFRFVRMRPLLGYGYAAFWTDMSRPARLIREAVHWDALPHAHNGSIDLLLALGCVGLALYLVVNGVAAWRAVLYLRDNREANAMWPLGFLCVIFLYQLDESSIVAGNQLMWILFSSMVFSLAIEARERAAPFAVEKETYSPGVVVANLNSVRKVWASPLREKRT